jgi:hypothetical protein
VKAAGANEILQIFKGDGAEAVEGERAGLAEVDERALDGFPGGVLG